MEPHRESTDGSNTSPASTLLSSDSQVFLVFFFSGSDSVLYSKFLCYVSGSSSRIAQCSTSPALLPWWRSIEANHLVSLGCSLCGRLFIAYSSWSLERENARTMKWRQVHHTSTSNDFHAALFVDEYPRPSIDVCTIGNSPTLHTNLAEPPLSVQLWVSKLSKSCQHFLNLLGKEKELWQVNVLSPRMRLHGTLSLFRTSFAGCYAFPCVSLGCDVGTCKVHSPEERRRQLAVALLRNTGEKPRARSASTRLPFFPGRRSSGWRRWLCSEWYRPSGDRCRPPKKWKLIQVWRVRVGVKLSCRGRRIFHGSEKKKKTGNELESENTEMAKIFPPCATKMFPPKPLPPSAFRFVRARWRTRKCPIRRLVMHVVRG